MSSEHDYHRDKCIKLEPLLEDYLSGELPRATAERLASHLALCSDCRLALDDARISARLVAGTFEAAEDPGIGFVRQVMARIGVADHWMQGQHSFWKPFEVLAWRLTFSAALALAFLFAYGVRVDTGRPATAVTAAFPQQPDIFAVPASTAPSNSDEVLMAIAEHRHER